MRVVKLFRILEIHFEDVPFSTVVGYRHKVERSNLFVEQKVELFLRKAFAHRRVVQVVPEQEKRTEYTVYHEQHASFSLAKEKIHRANFAISKTKILTYPNRRCTKSSWSGRTNLPCRGCWRLHACARCNKCYLVRPCLRRRASRGPL